MAKSESVLTIDIGSHSVKFAEFVYPSDGGLVLEKFTFSDFAVDTNGSDIENVIAEIRSTLAINDFKSRNVRVSVSAFSAYVKFTNALNYESQSDLESTIVFEAQNSAPFPPNEIVWDYQIVRDENSEEMDGGEADVMFVTVKEQFISDIVETLEDCGFVVDSVEISPTASFNACRINGVGVEQSEMLIDIGGKSTNLVFIDKDKIFIRPLLNISGDIITKQIAREFNISFADAEDMKRRHGFVALGGAYEEPDSQVAATVSKIVRNVMTRLHGEINRSINVFRSQFRASKPEKIYLSGGSSVMAFTPRFFSEKLRVPVEYFNPFQMIALSPEIDKNRLAEVAHMFSEIIGLGLNHGVACPVEINLVPEKFKKVREFAHRSIYFIASIITIVMLLTSTLVVVERMASEMNNLSFRMQKDFSTAKSFSEKIKKASGKLKSLNTEFDDLIKVFNKRAFWPKIFNDLQQRLDRRAWVVSFVPGKEFDAESDDSKKKQTVSFLDIKMTEASNDDDDDDVELKEYEIASIKLGCIAYVGADKTALGEMEGGDPYSQTKQNILRSPIVDVENFKVNFLNNLEIPDVLTSFTVQFGIMSEEE